LPDQLGKNSQAYGLLEWLARFGHQLRGGKARAPPPCFSLEGRFDRTISPSKIRRIDESPRTTTEYRRLGEPCQNPTDHAHRINQARRLSYLLTTRNESSSGNSVEASIGPGTFSKIRIWKKLRQFCRPMSVRGS